MSDSYESELTPEELQSLLYDQQQSAGADGLAGEPGEPHDGEVSQFAASNAMSVSPTPPDVGLSAEPDDTILVIDEICEALKRITLSFSDDFAATLGDRIDVEVATTFVGSSTTTAAEFFDGIEQPGCLLTLNASHWKRPVFWSWDLGVLYPLLDRLLGGGDLPATITRRALTEIEKRLVADLAAPLTQSFANAWETAMSLAPEIQKIESVFDAQAFEGKEDVLWVSELQLGFDEYSGPFRIAYDANMLVAHADSIMRSNRVASSHADISVVLAEIPTEEIPETLTVGEILETDAGANADAIIYIDGHPMHLGTPGALHGNKAVRISSPYVGEER